MVHATVDKRPWIEPHRPVATMSPSLGLASKYSSHIQKQVGANCGTTMAQNDQAGKTNSSLFCSWHVWKEKKGQWHKSQQDLCHSWLPTTLRAGMSFGKNIMWLKVRLGLSAKMNNCRPHLDGPACLNKPNWQRKSDTNPRGICVIPWLPTALRANMFLFLSMPGVTDTPANRRIWYAWMIMPAKQSWGCFAPSACSKNRMEHNQWHISC